MTTYSSGEESRRQHLSTQEADIDIVEGLRATGATGAHWEVLAGSLAAYGIGTLNRILIAGSIRNATASTGWPVLLSNEEQSELTSDPTARADLVHESVARGLVAFREKAVLGGTWSPLGGASLATYFINGCLREMPNVVRQWRTGRQERFASPVTTDQESDSYSLASTSLRRSASDPAELVGSQSSAEDILEELPVSLRTPIARVALLGETLAEAAAATGQSEKALEGKLYRYRRNRKQSR